MTGTALLGTRIRLQNYDVLPSIKSYHFFTSKPRVQDLPPSLTCFTLFATHMPTLTMRVITMVSTGMAMSMASASVPSRTFSNILTAVDVRIRQDITETNAQICDGWLRLVLRLKIIFVEGIGAGNYLVSESDHLSVL